MEEVLKLYHEGVSFREIERITGIPRKRASRYVQAQGFLVKKRGTTGSRRHVAVNLATFKQIDGPEKAYWLGFLFADGSIDDRSWILEFCQKTRERVEAFRSFMMSDATISKRSINLQEKQHTAYRVQICSKELCTDLIRLGCTPRKSLTKRVPVLPVYLQLPFLAGYFDGNGTLYAPASATANWHGAIATGSPYFAEGLAALVTRLGHRGRFRKDNGRENYYICTVTVDCVKALKRYSKKVQSKLCPLSE